MLHYRLGRYPLLSQLPQGLLDLAHRLRTVATGSGSEIPPKFDEQLVSIKRRVAVKYLPGALPCGSSQMLGILHPSTCRVLQVEGGNVGPNMGSAATPPSGCSRSRAPPRSCAAARVSVNQFSATPDHL